ncbi:hypothetical protein BC827DRAFT_1193455 [Russula dissimulans]|nr:hypothetical protein BC827DRAFT_1193455 [Russula dissimulans]
MIADHPLESYILELLEFIGKKDNSMENPPLGFARRAGAETSTFDVPAHKLLKALIEHSPSPETVAREFLVELVKCEISAVKELVHSLDSDHPASPSDWAAIVYQELSQNNGNTTYLTALASYYLSHLVIAFRNPGGKKTPQDSIHPTANLKRIEEIASLLESATVSRSQTALRDLVFLRDGTRCPVTNLPFLEEERVVPTRCAHIIPFSVHSKTHTHHAIEIFTGQTINAEVVQKLINHPANAINIESNAHETMDKRLAWGIEARVVDHEWKYYFRTVRPREVSATIPLKDGAEIGFGRGNGGDRIALPDPRICNLHLAVARVFAASGAAEVFDKYLDDDEDYITEVPVYFGGPFVDDDALMRRIEVLVT